MRAQSGFLCDSAKMFIMMIIMPRCETYMQLCVSVCARVDCYSCSRINKVQVRVSSWILIHIILRSRDTPNFACHCSLFRRVCSKTCSPSIATLLSS